VGVCSTKKPYQGANIISYQDYPKCALALQLLGSARRVFEDRRGRPDAAEQHRAAELQRLKGVIAEITAENLDLKKGRWG
jgi:hypothetical protein